LLVLGLGFFGSSTQQDGLGLPLHELSVGSWFNAGGTWGGSLLLGVGRTHRLSYTITVATFHSKFCAQANLL